MASKLPENIVIFFLFNHSVAKKKSLFDDRPMEIQELTYIIKQVQTSSCFFNYNDYYSCAVFSCIQSTSTVIFSIDLSTPASTLKLFVYFFQLIFMLTVPIETVNNFFFHCKKSRSNFFDKTVHVVSCLHVSAQQT